MKNAINGVGTPYPTGCTNAADGIKKAREELLGPRKRADAARFVIFLTDGLPNYPQCFSCPSNPGACPAAMSAAVSEATTAAGSSIVIYTIGLGAHVRPRVSTGRCRYHRRRVLLRAVSVRSTGDLPNHFRAHSIALNWIARQPEGEAYGTLTRILWLTAGLVVAVLAGLVAFTTLSRASAARSGQPAAQPTVSVVVATQAIAVRAVLAEADVELKEVPVDSVPEGAVSTVEDAVGKVTLVEVYPGEVLLAQRLIDPNETSGDGRVAVLLSEDEVLMAFPAGDLMSQSKVLKPGDRVDLLFSLDFPVNRALVAAGAAGEAAGGLANREEQATFNLLQNVAIAADRHRCDGHGRRRKHTTGAPADDHSAGCADAEIRQGRRRYR